MSATKKMWQKRFTDFFERFKAKKTKKESFQTIFTADLFVLLFLTTFFTIAFLGVIALLVTSEKKNEERTAIELYFQNNAVSSKDILSGAQLQDVIKLSVDSDCLTQHIRDRLNDRTNRDYKQYITGRIAIQFDNYCLRNLKHREQTKQRIEQYNEQQRLIDEQHSLFKD